MILKVFSIYDTKAALFSTPFFMHSAAQAIRACQDLLADMNTSVARHPADYALYELGSWDDNTAVFEPMTLINLGMLVSMLPEKTPQPSLIDFAAAVQRKAENS